jgi:conjugative transfer region protein (TIGR03748 family)
MIPNHTGTALKSPRMWAGAITTLLAITVLIGACATSATDGGRVAEQPVPLPAPEAVPVLRYGRYTLVELTPTRAQRDLMQQIVEITLPPTMNATVGEALRYLLLKTGFQLCDHSEAEQILDALPLPAADLHLGPMRLRDALQVLIGSAWSFDVDERTRRVCLQRAPAAFSGSPSAQAQRTEGTQHP